MQAEANRFLRAETAERRRLVNEHRWLALRSFKKAYGYIAATEKWCFRENSFFLRKERVNARQDIILMESVRKVEENREQVEQALPERPA